MDGDDDQDGGDSSDSGGMLQRLLQRAQELPGAGFAQRQMSRMEVLLLRQLKARLDRLESAPARRERTGERFAQLLERAAEQSHADALDDLYQRIIDALLPDEARILGALSDGSTYPLLHVAVGPAVGAATRRIADNFSSVGRPAGVKLLAQVPSYVSHLRALALVESAPEDKSLEIKYQILEGDQAVRRVVDGLSKGAGSSVRYLRRTLRLSAFGDQFWRACMPQ